jgi:hypothetical protein
MWERPLMKGDIRGSSSCFSGDDIRDRSLSVARAFEVFGATKVRQYQAKRYDDG